MPRHHLYTDNLYNGMSVNASQECPVYREQLDSIQDTLMDMIDKHSKVFVSHLEIRYPSEGDSEMGKTNEELSKCVRKFRMKSKREGVDCRVLWAREQVESNHPHYHCYVVSDGNKIQSSVRVCSWMNSIWSREVGEEESKQLVRYNRTRENKSGMCVERGAFQWSSLSEACDWMSYMAKTSGKENTPDGVRMFGNSQ